MISPVCSRWRLRCAHYRPAGEVVDVSRYEVALHARHAQHVVGRVMEAVS